MFGEVACCGQWPIKPVKKGVVGCCGCELLGNLGNVVPQGKLQGERIFRTEPYTA